jgi:hypothetical protein
MYVSLFGWLKAGRARALHSSALLECGGSPPLSHKRAGQNNYRK